MQKPFNITLIQPPGYVHSLALKEAAEYVHHMVTACGYQSRLTSNFFAADAYNVVFCAHLLSEGSRDRIPGDSIIFNSEQLEDIGGWHFASGVYGEMLERFHVWDYSYSNLEKIAHDRKSFIPFLYCRDLLRAGSRREQEVSLLFYGVITERRRNILNELNAAGVPVTVAFGLYGAQRDAEMFRSLAVLNLHKSDETSLFEPIRCFYPLINQIPVISEEVVGDVTADPYRESMCFLGQDDFVGRLIEGYREFGSFSRDLNEKVLCFQKTSAVAAISLALENFLQGDR